MQVKAKGSDKIVQGSVTGSDGNYTIGGLKKGEYVVTFLISAMKKYLKIFLSAAITRF